MRLEGRADSRTETGGIRVHAAGAEGGADRQQDGQTDRRGWGVQDSSRGRELEEQTDSRTDGQEASGCIGQQQRNGAGGADKTVGRTGGQEGYAAAHHSVWARSRGRGPEEQTRQRDRQTDRRATLWHMGVAGARAGAGGADRRQDRWTGGLHRGACQDLQPEPGGVDGQTDRRGEARQGWAGEGAGPEPGVSEAPGEGGGGGGQRTGV